jgi:CDP-6-deoxy-D-xylo-4-hexulose-3-dehydrase
MAGVKSRLWVGIGDFVVGDDETKAVNDVLRSSRITEGRKTLEFEKKWAAYVGTRYCVALNSGTSALIAGLTSLKFHRAFKIEEGRKVITTPLTYVATSNAIIHAGLEPVYVDVDEDTFCVTSDNVRNHLEMVDDSKDYSAILPVHLMGYLCDMAGINRVARQYGLVTIEDSSQAHGSLTNGQKAGSLSLFSTFSFYIAHNVQAGELGAVCTDDNEIARLVRMIKANGRMCDCAICRRSSSGCRRMRAQEKGSLRDPRFTHEIVGYNFKTMDLQTALASVQLKRISDIIKKRRENFKYLTAGLERHADILVLPKYDPNVSYFAYPLVIKERKRISRESLISKLEERGVEARPMFGCIPTQQPAYSQLRQEYLGKLPNAERIGSKGFYIGCHQYLNQEKLDHVIKVFKEVLA